MRQQTSAWPAAAGAQTADIAKLSRIPHDPNEPVIVIAWGSSNCPPPDSYWYRPTGAFVVVRRASHKLLEGWQIQYEPDPPWVPPASLMTWRL